MATESKNSIGIFIKFIPGIIALMGVFQRASKARQAAGEAKLSGSEKKELVLATVQTVLDSALAVSTGGQKETWEAIKEPVSMLIDAAATMKTEVPQ